MDIKKLVEQNKIKIGVTLIVLNFAIGFVSKLPFLQLIADPKSFAGHPLYYTSAVVAYVFSWVLGIVGVFLIGKETYEALQRKMQTKVRETYQEHLGKHVDRHVKPKVEKFVKAVKDKQEQIKEGLRKGKKKEQ